MIQKDKYSTENCTRIYLFNHEQYLEVLNRIRKDTQKIIIIQIDGYEEDDPIVNTAMEMMILEEKEKTSQWYGTLTSSDRGLQYTFLKKRNFFDYLSCFESFFISDISNNGYEVKNTDFGIDDIAFIDSNGELLFYTTTHEGIAAINKKYMKEKGILCPLRS
ncbi:MAG: hypothetical protein IJZ88_02190 [Clostridia bacterium]|nr:hypothetical protein [Clostridia bacterium]